MLFYRVEVKTATNPKMGLGLFTKEFIPKGNMFWKFIEGVDIKISKQKLNQLNDAQKEHFYKYAWIEKNEENYYYMSCDLNNFMNHSYTPNIDGSKKELCSYALKDIQVGEELFINYEDFSLDFDKNDVKE
jgi:SET domain-containing protein